MLYLGSHDWVTEFVKEPMEIGQNLSGVFFTRKCKATRQDGAEGWVTQRMNVSREDLEQVLQALFEAYPKEFISFATPKVLRNV